MIRLNRNHAVRENLLVMSLNCDLSSINAVIEEFAPEIVEIWQGIEDTSDERLGRLHENRILGIKLRYYFLNQPRTTTGDTEDSYEIFFQKIARSTVSTYLNQLVKEGVLYKEREGRVVYYLFVYDPPEGIEPFWLVRNFCTTPAYLARASFFSELYHEAGKTPGSNKVLKRFMIGVIILALLTRRMERCLACQFGTRSLYRKHKETLETALNDRQDVLPAMLKTYLLDQLGEIPIFGGLSLPETKQEIRETLVKYTEQFSQDLEFQIMVSERRQEVRLKQISKV